MRGPFVVCPQGHMDETPCGVTTNRIIDRPAELFGSAFRIDPTIEPKCIFWDEYQNHDKASILAEIINTGIEIV